MVLSYMHFIVIVTVSNKGMTCYKLHFRSNFNLNCEKGVCPKCLHETSLFQKITNITVRYASFSYFIV